MFRPTTSRRAARRTGRRAGAILVVVLATLTIFAIVGIAFVFYSDGEMLSARYAKEAESANGQMLPTPPPFDEYAEQVLSHVIFGPDPTDNTAQVTNAFRGHDLLSTVYGAHAKASATPYSGPGILHENLAKLTDTSFATVSDRARVVNQTVMNVGGKYLAFDPEISGEPRDVTVRKPIETTDAEITGTTPTRFHVAKNAPYTYPDLNNLYLASVSPATGEVLAPSYFRAWAFNDRPATLNGQPTPAPAPLGRRLAPWNPSDPELVANTDWVTAEGRAKILRPRPIDQLTPSELIAGWGKAWPPTEAEYSAPGFTAVKLYNKIDEKIRSGDVIGYPRPNADNDTTGDVFSYIGGYGNPHPTNGIKSQRNDSILMDFGAAPFEWPARSGKFVKPLAAVLVRDTDGLLNLNAHGNTRLTTDHTSYHGFGPWEVNLEAATATKAEAATIVASRYGKWGSPAARNNSTTQTLSFDTSGRRLAAAGPVNWDAAGTLPKGVAKAITVPTFGTNPFATVPSFASGFYEDNTDKAKATNHPALFNPASWAAFPEGKSLNPLPDGGNAALPFGYTYTHADTRRLHQRYAGELDLYQQMTFHKFAASPTGTLVGSLPPGAAYRTDPAHPRRGLFTTLSAGFDLPLAAPQASETDSFLFKDPSPYPNPGSPQPTTPVHAHNLKLSAATVAGTFLGPADLNRPLADYRGTAGSTNLQTELSSANITNTNQAWADRHNLARDVFIRLVVATGAISTSNVSLDSTGNLKLPQPSNSATYNGLRSLAQIAANVADYVDGDDVSTMFVWNPEDTSNAPNGLLVRVTDTSVVSTAQTAMADVSKVGERVVFGVEVPRLVINEVYAEIVDDPNGKGKANGQGKGTMDDGVARFWVELMNPSTPSPTGTAPVGVLGSGKVILKDTTTPAVKPYKLVIARSAKGADDIRYNPANVAGDLANPDIDYDFDDAGKGGMPNTEVAPNNGQYDAGGDPARGIVVAGPKVTGANKANEFDPKQIMPAPGWVNNMIESTSPAKKGGVSNGLEYLLTNPEVKTLDLTKKNNEFRRHVVLLRRLANPYTAFDATTNPYVTVDAMDWVAANDGLFTGNGSGNAGGVPIQDRTAVGRVQPYAGHAYPDNPDDDSNLLRYSFPTSCLLKQAPGTPGTGEPLHTFGRHNGTDGTTGPTASTLTPAAPAPTTGLTSGETLMAPYDWLVHMDRPLVNQLELLHLQAGKPHEVTYYFVQPPGGPGEGVRRQVGLVPWFGIVPETPTPTAPHVAGHPYTLAGQSAVDTTATARSNNGLFRGLEYLRVKPWTYGAGAGGRVHGRLNINTIQDIRVWTALADRRAASEFTQAEQDARWTDFFTSKVGGASPNVRTYRSEERLDAINQKWTVPVPGETVDDADPFRDPDAANYHARLLKLDRPFKPFGVADAPPPPATGTTWAPPKVSPAGSGVQDTLLRAADPKTGRPLLYGAVAHPYLEAELARKVFNNTTTVSNVFAVHVTIVYHEVRMDTTTTPPSTLGETINVETDDDTTNATQPRTRYYLGRESFREVPGDMRQQYLAVVDRSSAVVRSPYPTSSQDLQATPFSAALAADVAVDAKMMTLVNAQLNAAGTGVIVYADGIPVEINAGTRLRLGSGADTDWAEVTSVTDNKGVYEINFKNAVTTTKSSNERAHPAGTAVTSFALGRPTKPTTGNFTPIRTPDAFRQNGYPLLIPYAGRVR